MENLGGKLLNKTAVVAYKNYGAAKVAQGIEQHVLGMKIQVVGWFVEY